MNENGMIRPSFFSEQYQGTYQCIVESAKHISHQDSLKQVLEGVNCLNWQVGHVVVARTNFLMLLEVPSIWSWEQIKRYVPGSDANPSDDDGYQFSQLVADLGRTQEQLLNALEKVTTRQLQVIKDGQSVAEHLAFYAAHEAGHTGQIELISKLLTKETS